MVGQAGNCDWFHVGKEHTSRTNYCGKETTGMNKQQRKREFISTRTGDSDGQTLSQKSPIP